MVPATALEVIGREGVHGLPLHRLGHPLGRDPMTFYGHPPKRRRHASRRSGSNSSRWTPPTRTGPPNSGLSRATTDGRRVTTAGSARNFIQTHAHAAQRTSRRR